MTDAMDKDVQRAIAAVALRDDDLLSLHKAVELLAEARDEHVPAVDVLLRYVDEAKLRAVLAEELDVAFVNLSAADSGWTVDDDTMRNLDDLAALVKASAIVVRSTANVRMVLMSDPFVHDEIKDYLREEIGEFVLGLGMPHQINARLGLLDTSDTSILEVLDELAAEETPADQAAPTVAARQSPVVEWVEQLFSRAAVEGASDVHMQFQRDKSLLVRFRVDGVLTTIPVPPKLRHRETELVGALLNKCRTINPSDKTRPQDGTFSFTTPRGKRIDTRLAMLPQTNGPTVVTRLLDPENVRRKLDDMGFAPQTLSMMREAVTKSQGMVLMVGPTGSGKTTSLYGLLNELDAGKQHILTAEDPVEYRMERIGQTQIRSDLGDKSLTFAATLRAMLRLDPDVILVGEIRDRETAEVALHAALTGHLLLSTLHTNSAMGVITRLQELGVEPFAIGEALSLSASQRLVRRLHSCATFEAPTPGEVAFLQRQGFEVPDKVGHPRVNGCPGCRNSGYSGRVPVLEAFAPTEEIRLMIATEQPLPEIKKVASANGYVSILQDGFRHVQAGSTTVSELLRCLDSGAAS
jgi:type II secretory ATPase GspE/PulE/Tfp pilus assembly ATPase PilB-like protein